MRFFTRLLFSLVLITGLSATAHAQTSTPTTPGCGDAQWEAQVAAREAYAAVDVADHEERRTQPDSVLATSCFDQWARVSANEGGQIFSGDFTSDMAPIVLQPMQNLLNSNFLGSIGRDPDFGQIVTTVLGALLGGIFGGGMTGGSFDCSVQQDIYDAQQIQGINPNAQMITIDDAISIVANGQASGGTRFLAGLAAASDIFMRAQNAVDNIQQPRPVPSVGQCTGNSDPLNCVLSLYGF